MQGYQMPNAQLPQQNGNYLAPTVIPGQPSPIPGMPAAPGYSQDYNPYTMSLSPGYQAAQSAADQKGFNQFEGEALRKGPSAWATLANQQLQNTTNNARDNARDVSAGNTAQTLSSLASGGGLSSGARERAQEGGAKSAMSADQSLARQQTQNQYQIGANDEQNRMQQLSQLPQMEQNKLNSWESVRNQDLQNQIAENQSQNNYNMGIYGINSTAAAAKGTSDAMSASADAQANAPSLGNLFGLAPAIKNGFSWF